MNSDRNEGDHLYQRQDKDDKRKPDLVDKIFYTILSYMAMALLKGMIW